MPQTGGMRFEPEEKKIAEKWGKCGKCRKNVV
jgi:hypothetical protein